MARQCVAQWKLRPAPPSEPGQMDPRPAPGLKALTCSSFGLNVHRARTWGAKGKCQPKAQHSFLHHTLGTCACLHPEALLPRPDQSSPLARTHLNMRGGQAWPQDVVPPGACTQKLQVQVGDGAGRAERWVWCTGTRDRFPCSGVFWHRTLESKVLA